MSFRNQWVPRRWLGRPSPLPRLLLGLLLLQLLPRLLFLRLRWLRRPLLRRLLLVQLVCLHRPPLPPLRGPWRSMGAQGLWRERGPMQGPWLQWLRVLVLQGRLALLMLGVALMVGLPWRQATGLALGLSALSAQKTSSLAAPRGAGDQLGLASCGYGVRGTSRNRGGTIQVVWLVGWARWRAWKA